MAARELGDGAVGERDRDDQIAGTDGRCRLVLHHGVHAVAHDVERQVGEAPRRIGDELYRVIVGRALQQEAVVGELAEDDDSVGDGIGAAAVLVDASADVEAGRHVGELTIGRASEQDHSALLVGARLQQVEVVAVGAGLGQSA